MKKLSIYLFLLIIPIILQAQVPQAFNYQAVVRDNTGEILLNQNVGIKISIQEEGVYNVTIYAETFDVNTNDQGLVSLKIGTGTTVIGSFADIDWGGKTYLLQTEIDVEGGTNYQLMGSQQLVSVPYAMHARGLTLMDENGNEYEITVDPSGNLVTNQIQPFNCGDNLTDSRDGKTYATVQIGHYCWMAENLNVGTMISGSMDQTDNEIIEKYCYQDNTTYCGIYGGMYMWDEMMQYRNDTANTGICPEGWRIPTDYEWKILEGMADTQIGLDDPLWNQSGWRGSNAGGNFKETGTTHWHSPNTGATNFTGFTALGTGIHDGSAFSGLSYGTLFWCSNEVNSTMSINRNINWTEARVGRGELAKVYALPVRCIKNTSYDNSEPNNLYNPNPPDESEDQPLDVDLSWSGIDPDGDPLYYDVYFGTETHPPLIAAGIMATTYDPGPLNGLETYYWQIASHDFLAENKGPVWRFTTTWGCGNPITDPRDNQTYTTVQIGTQCWLAENLNIGNYIPASTPQTNNPYIEKHCYDNNIANCDEYGGLYQWDEMMQYSTSQILQGICPPGWHIPQTSEWAALTAYLGGDAIAGGKMKEAGFDHWLDPNTGGTNESGFTALPAGENEFYGSNSFYGLKEVTYLWSSHETGDEDASARILTTYSETCDSYVAQKERSISVRCIKD